VILNVSTILISPCHTDLLRAAGLNSPWQPGMSQPSTTNSPSTP